MGPLEATVDGRPLVVDTRKALAILVLLAVEARRFARDELAAMLWPESGDEASRGALRRTLSVLHAAVGEQWLHVDRAAVRLEGAGVWLDLEVLGAAAGRGDPAELAAAADLARGPFLAGFSLRDSPEFDDWRATRAVVAERTVAALLDRLVTVAEAIGDRPAALAAATRRVDLDPLDEAAQRRLIAQLARSGDRAGAIRQYRSCVATLERELGVAPLAETTELYEAVRDARVAVLPGASVLAAPSTGLDAGPRVSRLPLVGRDAELSLILAAHRDAARDGRIVLLTGEAGIGKSRLADAAADEVVSAGGTALVARAFTAEQGIAYGSVAELLRAGLARPDALRRLRSCPDAVLAELRRLVALPAEIGARAARRSGTGEAGDPAAPGRLLDAIVTALTALAAGPVAGLIVVEDLQWADVASREAMLYLARRMDNRRLVLLLTWRPEDLDDAGIELAAALEGLRNVTDIALGRLDRAAVGRLVDVAAAQGAARADVDGMLDASEGLPLYVVEALAAGPVSEGAARSVRTLLRARLASVSETAAQVLAAAAVIGRSFDLPLVRGTSGRSEEETIDALEELVRRGIVRGLPEATVIRFDFAHARLREAAYESIGLARRRLLHRRAADVLRGDTGGRTDPGRFVQLAIHERAAGRDAEAADAYREAGLRARAVYAYREADLHLASALALGHPDAAGIQLSLGEVRTFRGDYAGAILALEAAAASTPTDGLPILELLLGRVHARRGDLTAAASHLEAAIEALEADAGLDVEGRSDLARAQVELAAVALRAGDLDRAERVASGALTLAAASDDVAGIGAANRILGLAARERGDLAKARDALSRSVDLADGAGDASAAIAGRNALALVEAAAGDRDAAITLLEEALVACGRTGERHLEAAIENNLADQLHAAGRRDEAMIHLKRAVTLFAEVGGPDGMLEPEIWKLVSW